MTSHRLINRTALGLLIVGGLFAASHTLHSGSAFAKVSGHGQTPPNAVMKEMAPTELGHIGHLDYLNGFRSRKFGADISQFQDLTLLKDKGAQKTYESKTESLEIGEGVAQSINYIFYKNKFMGVQLTAQGEENRHYIYQVFVAAFGNGIKPPTSKDNDEYFWTGKTANARLVMNGKGEMKLWIGSNSLQEEYEKEFREKVLQAATKSF